jgi:hypothetical protein
LRACSRCALTSRAAFFFEKRIWTMASSTVLPAICRASGPSFLTDVLMSWLFSVNCRSVRWRSIVFDRRPPLRISRITILRCHLSLEEGSGSSFAAMITGLRAVLAASPPCLLGRGPAALSSSKIDDDASSPRVSVGRESGFFRRNSSVSSFLGRVGVKAGFLFQKNDLRCDEMADLYGQRTLAKTAPR